MAIDNLLIPESFIVQRITTEMMTGAAAVLRAVMTKEDLESITEEKQVVPAVSVVFDGFFVNGAGTELESMAGLGQRWLTVVTVANSARMRESAHRNQGAGPLLWKLWQALHGFVPVKGFTPLVPISPPRPHYSGGFAYFPLAWSTSMTMCRSN